VTSCSSDAPPTNSDDCSSVVAPPCDGGPKPQPSFKNDVQPLIDKYCLACHGDGGIEVAMFDYTTYQGIAQHTAQMVTQVYQCAMPPLDASPLPPMPTVAERETILAWIACGAPNN
jgi:hypothetical protein